MKTIFESLLAAFSMYSRIPVPHIKWSEHSMRYAMCFFPWVGAVIGLLEYVWFLPYRYGVFGAWLYGTVAVALPVLITGGIHVDGFLDTCDALSSWREKKDRLRILKDSHVGGKTVVWTCLLFLVASGFAAEITEQNILPFCMIFMLARSFSAFSVVSPYFPKANPEGTLAAFSDNAEKRTSQRVSVIYMVILAAALLLSGGAAGVCVFIVGLASFFLYRHICMAYFGGTTGDLAGFFVTYSEFLMLSVCVICNMVMK